MSTTGEVCPDACQFRSLGVFHEHSGDGTVFAPAYQPPVTLPLTAEVELRRTRLQESIDDAAGTRILHERANVLLAVEQRLPKVVLALERLAAAVDDLNAEGVAGQTLCLLCRAMEYSSIVGVVHEPDCELLNARTVLAVKR